jgi:VCBS repeat-containing protein
VAVGTGLVSNDTDPDATDVPTVQNINTTGTVGNVTFNADGSFSYDPNGQFESLAVGETTTDTFSYTPPW